MTGSSDEELKQGIEEIEGLHMSQQAIWDAEHKNPTVLLQMNSHEPSSGVVKFWEWYLEHYNNQQQLTGLEIGCGKGRNSIWLAQQGVNMTGYDFAESAINEANKRATEQKCQSIKFLVQDVTKTFPISSASVDFVIDCFASTDIDNFQGRCQARNEIFRILKPEGLLFVYTLSTEDEFHKQKIQSNPAEEKNAFLHPQTGKFEKVFSKKELLDFYKDFNILEYQTIHKVAEFFGKSYQCYHHWLILSPKKN